MEAHYTGYCLNCNYSLCVMAWAVVCLSTSPFWACGHTALLTTCTEDAILVCTALLNSCTKNTIFADIGTCAFFPFLCTYSDAIYIFKCLTIQCLASLITLLYPRELQRKCIFCICYYLQFYILHLPNCMIDVQLYVLSLVAFCCYQLICCHARK